MKVHKNQDVTLRYSWPDLDISLLHNIHFRLLDNYGVEVARYAINPEVDFDSAEIVDIHNARVVIHRSLMQTLKNKVYYLQIQLLQTDPDFENGYKVHSTAYEVFEVVGEQYATSSEYPPQEGDFDLETEVRNIIDRVYGGASPGGGTGGATPAQVAAINLNTAKVGITNEQANAIITNTAKRSYPSADEQKLAGIQAGATVGATPQQVDAIAANTAKVGISTQQAADIQTNNQKRSYPTGDQTKLSNIEAGATVGATTSQAAAIAANTLKVGITTAQANAIAANTAKVGITAGQASAIVANTAKRTYPTADEQKLAAIVTPPPLRNEPAAITLSAVDAEGYIRYTGATNITVTVPNTIPVEGVITLFQAGLGVITLQADAGVTLNGKLKTAGQHSAIQLIKVANNLFDVLWGSENIAIPVRSMVFHTSGDTFEPLITLRNGATATWTLPDNTVRTGPNPSINFGSVANREVSLLVSNWNDLTEINMGYDARDGGSPEITLHPTQQVTRVENLDLVSSSLVGFYCSHTPIQSLDFANFIQLIAVECFYGTGLTNITLNNTPNLTRVCVEGTPLTLLDLSQSPAMEDVRCSNTQVTEIRLGATGSNIWHFCAWGNYQLTVPYDLSRLTNVRELWIWNNTIFPAGWDFNSQSRALTSCIINNLDFGSINVSNCPNLVELQINSNRVTALDISGCPQLRDLSANDTQISTNTLNSVLDILANGSVSNGTITAQRNNPITNNAAVNTLVLRGWDISANITPIENTVATPTISVSTGTYSEEQSVTIACATAAASIYYTTDGSAPTSSSTLYNGAISVSETTTIRAIAILTGYINSVIAQSSITISADSPTRSQISVTITGNQGMTIRLGTTYPNQEVSIDWQDGSPVEVLTLDVQLNPELYQNVSHVYPSATSNTAIVSLPERIVYVGVPNGESYSGDWSSLGIALDLYFVFIYNNNFSFDMSSWNNLANMYQYHLATNNFTQAQIDTVVISTEEAMRGIADLSGRHFYIPGDMNLLSAGALSAFNSLENKGMATGFFNS